MQIMWFFAYKSFPNFLFGVLCLPGDHSHPFCATDNKPSCVLHLLDWFIGLRSFPSLEQRLEFWVLQSVLSCLFPVNKNLIQFCLDPSALLQVLFSCVVITVCALAFPVVFGRSFWLLHLISVKVKRFLTTS